MGHNLVLISVSIKSENKWSPGPAPPSVDYGLLSGYFPCS